MKGGKPMFNKKKKKQKKYKNSTQSFRTFTRIRRTIKPTFIQYSHQIKDNTRNKTMPYHHKKRAQKGGRLWN